MRAITTSALRTIAAFASACAVITLVVVGVQAAQATGPQTTTASLSAADDPAAEPTGDTTGDTTGAAADGARKQLRADLRAARALTGDERKAALAKIHQDARAGVYGDAVQRRFERRAERRTDRREVVLALLPEELQADLKAVREAPADQRAAMRKQVLDDALAGKYGDQVAAAAKKLQELRTR